MPPIGFGAHDLLEYNPQYRLLICRECQYAIQKNALESHLLRHKIYRADRQRLLSEIAQLNLLEPLQVPLPPPNSPPFDALPILSGYRCTAAGCRQLTASSKRMKRHCSEIHGLAGSVPLSLSLACPVKLQTFFRGTKVRYFEVASPIAPQLDTDDRDDDHEQCQEDHNMVNTGNDDDDHEQCQEGHNSITATPSLPPCMPTNSGTAPGLSPTDFNLETLTYFHHFITITSLTIPGTQDPSSANHYWQMHVVLALRRRWLMCGLMAISACHLATLADDGMTKQIHRERETQFCSELSAGLAQTTGSDISVEADEIEAEAKKTGQQITCLLHCAQWALAEPSIDHGSGAPCQLLSIMSNLRGCVVHDSALCSSSISDNGHGRQEELTVQGFLHLGGSAQAEGSHTNSSSNDTPSVLPNLLDALPSRIAEVLGRPESVQDVFATLSAIKAVAECCGISFACDEAGPAWQGLATWLAIVPDHFNQMIRCDHPAALVVLAHWAAILVNRAERAGYWFFEGLSEDDSAAG